MHDLNSHPKRELTDSILVSLGQSFQDSKTIGISQA